MNLLDGAELSRTAITPALDKIERELIPQLDAVVKTRVDDLTEQMSNVLSGVLQGVQATADKATVELTHLLAELDGWTLVIPEIRIQLRAPEKK